MIEPKAPVYHYRTVEDDLLGVKQYTLSNGLQLFLSVNPNEPRIFTNIAVRAGSKQDPPETTGLAHYMEHMLFKGTSKIGALNWEKEKPLLEKISDLYEQYRQTEEPGARRKIYAEIDRISYEAAQWAAPNEYDKLVSALGAQKTNAYTWVEQTVFVNDIPSNELERWMKLEAERFRMMALRLFHTELETVYEEFNMMQDMDFRKVNQTLRASLFPKHPYGAQTTIGSAENLKNPSQVNIQRYFNTYYAPNNMAVILAGDFDPDEAVRLAEQYFGGFERRSIPPFDFPEQPPITEPIRREVFGQESPFLSLGWRLGNSQTDDPLMAILLQDLLFNERAGLFDLHLNQRQKVLESEAWVWIQEDYSAIGIQGMPREEQSLEDVEQLMLAEVDRLRRGDFPDWMLEATIKDVKLNDLRASESNELRTHNMTASFVLGIDWQRSAHRVQWVENITKEKVVEFARRHLREDNFALVYKRQGPDPNVIKVQKPTITPVELNRGALSEYGRDFLSFHTPRLKPEFIDFEQHIQQLKLNNGLPLHYVHNRDNSLFQLDYILEMGKTSSRKLAIALLYLPYLGTNRFSPAGLQQELFRLGVTLNVQSGDERSRIGISGLADHFEEAVQLFEHILANVQPNKHALENVISDILTRRANAKQERQFILRKGLVNYARYGAHSPFTHRLSERELRALEPEELTRIIHSLTSHQHHVYYYGSKPLQEAARTLNRLHQTPEQLQPLIPPQEFEQLDTEQNQVYFLDFPIVQNDLLLMSKGTPHFNREEYLMHDWFNEYFGYGLSSIVFQEIRESKALAYATYAYYSSPTRKDLAHYLQAYVGTQPDKLSDALPALLDIIENMPVEASQIEHARHSMLRQLESDRIMPRRLFWERLENLKLGVDGDLRKDVYESLRDSAVEDLTKFHDQYVRGRNFNLVVMGDRSHMDWDFLNTIGEVQELSLRDVFGY